MEPLKVGTCGMEGDKTREVTREGSENRSPESTPKSLQEDILWE